MPFAATWMDVEMIIPSEIGETWYDTACGWNLKYDINELIYEIETESQQREQTGGCPEVLREGEIGSLRLQNAN